MTLAVAVLTLTRDRLDYTKHSFQTLHDCAGMEFDHYILDNGSDDGTQEWLDSYEAHTIVLEPKNIGRCRALNRLVDLCNENDDYDVIVTFDNDCELTQSNTIRDLASLVDEGGCILSPRVLGLRQPPQPMRELRIGDETIQDIPQIGGICMAIPAWIYTDGGFRYDETQMIYDDIHICGWFRQQGGTCGYVKRLECWHYETTDGQHERYPDYFARKYSEIDALGVK